jgi:hypothetical protein
MRDPSLEREVLEDGMLRRDGRRQRRCLSCMTSLRRALKTYQHVAANHTLIYTCTSAYCIYAGTLAAMHPMRFDDINELLARIRAWALWDGRAAS